MTSFNKGLVIAQVFPISFFTFLAPINASAENDVFIDPNLSWYEFQALRRKIGATQEDILNAISANPNENNPFDAKREREATLIQIEEIAETQQFREKIGVYNFPIPDPEFDFKELEFSFCLPTMVSFHAGSPEYMRGAGRLAIEYGKIRGGGLPDAPDFSASSCSNASVEFWDGNAVQSSDIRKLELKLQSEAMAEKWYDIFLTDYSVLATVECDELVVDRNGASCTAKRFVFNVGGSNEVLSALRNGEVWSFSSPQDQ